jgi:glutathione S-transferase
VRADITRWQCWQLAHWSPATGAFIFENLIKGLLNMGPPDPAALKKGEEAFAALASVLDGHLAGRDYLVGKSLTLADFSVAANLALAQPAKIPVDKYPNITRWYGRIAATEAWKKTEPKMG